MIQRNLVHLLNVAIREYRSLQASSSIWASEASLARTRERGASPLARETCFTRPNRRACSQVMSIAATSPSFVILHYFNNRCLIFTSVCLGAHACHASIQAFGGPELRVSVS